MLDVFCIIVVSIIPVICIVLSILFMMLYAPCTLIVVMLIAGLLILKSYRN